LGTNWCQNYADSQKSGYSYGVHIVLL
jgi:hypothetical protein